MGYVALYRKYRPQTFAETEMVGQRHITRTLQNALAAGRVSHAYLFCGPRGTGKTTTARLLAKALNCDSGPTPNPCDHCPPCEAIRSGSALDVVEIDAASNRGIEDIRQLRERVGFAPAEGRYKVYIIDEVHMLTNEAFNALLKTLEEPPPHVIFVMATTEAHRLPATILSRCQRFDFHRVPIPDMIARLRDITAAEGVASDEPALNLLARAAEGSMRDALSLLEQAQAYATGPIGAEQVQAILGGVDADLLLEFGRVIAAQDTAAAFRLVDRAVNEGKDVRAMVGELVDHFRNLLLLRTVKEGEALVALPPAVVAQLSEQAGTLPPELLVRALETFSEAERELRWSTQQRLVLELALVKLCRPAPVPSAQPAAQPAAKPASKAAPAPVKAAAAPAPPAAAAAAPPPEQPAPEQAPAAAAAGEGDPLAQVRENWAALLQQLRRGTQVQVAAFLTEASPEAVENGVLTLSFRHEFHCDKMSQRADVLQELLTRELGLALTVRCVMSKQAGEQGAATGPSVISRGVLSVFPGSMEVGK